MKKNIKMIVPGIAGVILICCLVYMAIYYINGNKSEKDLNKLAARLEAADALSQVEIAVVDPQVPVQVETKVPPEVEIEIEPVMLSKFVELHNENPDLIGWIKIEGTKVNYPVMQTIADPEFYLRRNFEKKSDRGGLPFLDYRSDLWLPSTNFIIYGHNMENGTMFKDILKYKKIKYYIEHPIISFDTLYEESEYQIVSVFPSQIYKVGDQVFKYYKFIQAEDEETFDDFVDNIKKLSLYETGVSAEFGDQLITLSTCEYSTENGRFVVVAKKKTKQDKNVKIGNDR